MKARNIPFGYRWENGSVSLHETESQTVKGIYADYLNGQSLLQIASKLNKQGIEYMPGVFGWNKARLKRIIEDLRYLGNDTFPMIIEQATFDRVQGVKAERNTQKDLDRTADILNLNIPVCCEQCGKPMQRLHDKRTTHKDKWVCQACGAFIKIADELLLAAITDTLNQLIGKPSLVHYTQSESRMPIEVIRLKNEIGKMLDSPMIDKEAVRNRIFDYASMLYSEYDITERITEQIRAALQKHELLSEYSGELTQSIVTAIVPHPDKTVTLTLKNGQEIRKEKPNASDADQDGASDTADNSALQCVQQTVYYQTGSRILPCINQAG